VTHFEDGPAKGQHLMLKRTPIYLRVVQSEGKWDALDMPEDDPRNGEVVHAYRLKERSGMCHVNMGSGKGGFYPIAIYRAVSPQPTVGEMANRSAWVKWCEDQ